MVEGVTPGMSEAVPRYRVLLVEDDPGIPELVGCLLGSEPASETFTLDHVDTAAGARRCLATTEYHVVLLDLDLPDTVDHLATIGELRDAAPDVPVVVLSGMEEHDVALDTVRAGAQDYLPKRLLSTYTLSRVLRYAIERARWHDHIARETTRLRQVNARLEEFAGLVAHDLKGPLASVLGLAHTVPLVEGPQLSPRQRDLLSRLAGAAERMSSVVDGLLDATREPEFAHRQPVALTELAEDVAAMLGPAVSDAEAHIRVGPLPTVWGVPALLRQALQNLIGNAIVHYEGEGAPTIDVTAAVEGDVVITVSDDGPGIPAEARHQVFERGFSTGSRGRGHAGLGLGLSSARTAIARLGGEIWVDEADSGGAAVCFSLPRRSLVDPNGDGQGFVDRD